VSIPKRFHDERCAYRHGIAGNQVTEGNNMKHMTTRIAATLMMIGTLSPAVAMEQELNQLTGAVYNGLTSMQMDVADITNLTLGEINRINSIMFSGDSESEKKNKISNILRLAAER